MFATTSLAEAAVWSLDSSEPALDLLAEDDGTTGASSPDTSPDASSPAYTVDGITLYYETPYIGAGWEKCANSWEATPQTHGKLTAKAQTLAFKVQLVWSDASTSWAEGAAHPVTFRTSDENLATVTAAGVLMAKNNGQVTLTASCEGHEVSYILDITGQENERYVSEIVIVDDSLTPYDAQAGIALSDLNQTITLNARVTVVDPATNTSKVYYSKDGLLSAQTGGAIADLSWSVGDSELGSVEATTGEFRPAQYANVLVTAASAAGLGGQSVTGSVWVYTDSPVKQAAGRNPQDHLTVRVFYEENPETIVKEVTFTREEVEALGCELHTYTAVGSGAMFATASARGVPFARVLEAAGANLDGISYFSFVTADSGNATYGETVSYKMLFGQTRYYFPNWDIHDPTDGVAVPPMLAIESNFRWFDVNTQDVSENYTDMTDDTCFRLLFGATTSGQVTTNRQIYWINTINVVLEGAAPVENGNGDGSGSGTGGSGGTSTTNGQALSGNGPDASQIPGSLNGLGLSAAGGAAEAAGETDTGDSGDEGAWSVYQIMNRNRSDVDDVDFENPFAPFALPCALGVTAAGAVWTGAWYRRQKVPLRSETHTLPET